MKKISVIFMILLINSIFLVSCAKNHEPADTVQNYLLAVKKQSPEANGFLSGQVTEIIKPEEILNIEGINDNVKTAYQEAIFDDFDFYIGDSQISGNSSMVEVTIETYDFFQVKQNTEDLVLKTVMKLEQATQEELDAALDNLMISQLRSVSKVKTNFEIPLEKINGTWMISDTTACIEALTGGLMGVVADVPRFTFAVTGQGTDD